MTTLLSGRSHSGEPLDDDVDLERDRALVSRAQSGDQAAFDDLYLRYNRRLHRFCLRRLHDVHEAEDVTQEAFARAWRALPNFGGDRRFYPWLSVIASHLCTDTLRKRARTTPVAEFHQANLASTEDSGEELVISAVDGAMATQAFGRLSERHQRILQLREESGWSYQRIADHEGVGITAVETLLWRARQALKREFASLAGSEGRLAGWIGGLVSVASLRRILRGLPRGARHLAHHASRGPMVAMGSAAAATAMVVAASMSPQAATSPTPLPGTTSNSAAFAPAVPNSTVTSGNKSAAATDGSSGSASTSQTSGAGQSSALTPTGATGAGAVLGSVNAVGNGVVTGVQQLGATVGTLVNGVTNAASQLLSPLSTLPGLGSSLGSSLQSTVDNTTSLGTSVVSGVQGAAGTSTGLSGAASSAGTTVGTTTGAVGTTVGTTVNTVTSTANKVLGGL